MKEEGPQDNKNTGSNNFKLKKKKKKKNTGSNNFKLKKKKRKQKFG